MDDRAPASESARIGRRFRDGDPEATAEVRSRVRRTLAFRGYGIPSEERADLEQIVMTQLWEAARRAHFDPDSGFWAFVELVVARRCIDFRRARRTEVPLDPEVVGPDPAPGPLASVLGRERASLAQVALESLPEPCRELFRLRFERNLGYAEAAEALGVRSGTLRVRMHRCVQQAQAILARLADASGNLR